MKQLYALFILFLTVTGVYSQCFPPVLGQEICLVTVDSATNKNVLVWEKGATFDIDHYNIYKEDGNNNYQKIAQVSVDSFSVFIDNNSDPDTKEERYKLSYVNKCGAESPKSTKPHRTMRLWGKWVNGGTDWECHWGSYEGFGSAGTALYKIYRGTDLDRMTPLHSFFDLTPLHQWTDTNPPAGQLFYRVEMLNLVDICVPSFKKEGDNFNTSKSNTIDTEIAFGVGGTDISKISWELYPNPVKNNLKISLNGTVAERFNIQIINALGQVIEDRQFDPFYSRSNLNLDVSSLNNGAYFVSIISKDSRSSKRFILNR